ncbi:MAG: hypothetical protein E7Z88_07985 [Cyanobacteria bacterium SIG27]|nr:hypothetical protein [Cyanobacteria bacterium SIG27]
MDISIFNALALVAIFLPLVFGFYLSIARWRLSFVNKWVLNCGCAIVNLFSFVIFSLIYFLNLTPEILKYSYNFFSIQKFSLEMGLIVDEKNALFLALASFLSFVISYYSKIYFDKKKQFIFTKQRFYAFLSFLSFLGYLFIASLNLIQSVVVLIIQSVLILAFSYFDIFKKPTNYNITRFHRISHIGNFSLLVCALILFKYSILSQGYIDSTSINYDEFNILISYMYGISSSIEFKLMAGCLLFGIMSRLMIFPLSCYYSFFANSSNILYLSIITLANNIAGMFLYLKTLSMLLMSPRYVFCFEIFLGIGIALSLFQILFEKNIKIIFGYLISIINSIFMILFLTFETEIVLYSYFAVFIFFSLILMILFMYDKTNLKKGLINKNLGFILEKTHISIFETLPVKLAQFVEFLDEKIFQNIFIVFLKVFDFLTILFTLRVEKIKSFKSIKNVLVIFALVALFAIFIALFGGFKC